MFVCVCLYLLSDASFPGAVKVIITVANYTGSALVFVNSVVQQFNLDAVFDGEEIVQYIRGKKVKSAPSDTYDEPQGTCSDVEGFLSQCAISKDETILSAASVYLEQSNIHPFKEVTVTFRNCFDFISFYRFHEKYLNKIFVLYNVVVSYTESDSKKHSGRNNYAFLLQSEVAENVYIVKSMLNSLHNKLSQFSVVRHNVGKAIYQQLVDVQSKIMSCIQANHSYSQTNHDSLLSELNISIRMKPATGPNGIRYVVC